MFQVDYFAGGIDPALFRLNDQAILESRRQAIEKMQKEVEERNEKQLAYALEVSKMEHNVNEHKKRLSAKFAQGQLVVDVKQAASEQPDKPAETKQPDKPLDKPAESAPLTPCVESESEYDHVDIKFEKQVEREDAEWPSNPGEWAADTPHHEEFHSDPGVAVSDVSEQDEDDETPTEPVEPAKKE
jgi:hypothetical protein